MARLEIFDPICEMAGCAARATRKVVGEDGTAFLTCTKHAQRILIDVTDAEKKKSAIKEVKG